MTTIKQFYLIENQLISVAAFTSFGLTKNPWEMNEAELDSAERDTST